MRISGTFPSDYLKAPDLQGQKVLVKMTRVEMRDIADEVKPVLYFEGKEKGLVLNKTNSNTISAAWRRDRGLGGGRNRPLPDDGRVPRKASLGDPLPRAAAEAAKAACRRWARRRNPVLRRRDGNGFVRRIAGHKDARRRWKRS
jgi:hypothetical protein